MGNKELRETIETITGESPGFHSRLSSEQINQLVALYDELKEESEARRELIKRLTDKGWKLKAEIKELQKTITYLEEAIQVLPECLEQEVKQQEASDIIKCIKDAKRVHPDWVIDDVIELLEFRENTKQALKEG